MKLEGVVNGWNAIAEKYAYFPKAETVKRGLIITGIALAALSLLSLSILGGVMLGKALAVASSAEKLMVLMILVNTLIIAMLLKRRMAMARRTL